MHLSNIALPALLAGFFVLTGCASSPPVISEFNGTSVKVRQWGVNNEETDAVAQQACGSVGKSANLQTAEAYRGQIDYFYVCL